MRTESEISQPLIKAFKWRPYSVFIKHADMSTVGNPDSTWTTRGTTIWLELKVVRKKYEEISKTRNYTVQSEVMKKLFRCGKAAYIVFYEPTDMIEVWFPDELAQKVKDENSAVNPVYCSERRTPDNVVEFIFTRLLG